MSLRIDLNCDMGESFGRYRLGADVQVMDFITSANIACGLHAGDPRTMRETVQLAADKSVAIGAHPGLPDLQGFGRRNMDLTPQEMHDMVLYQIGALDAFLQPHCARMQHVKPHGALYNMAARNYSLAESLARAIKAYRQDLIFIGLPNSEMQKAAEKEGVRFAAEVFADRTYQPDGSLTSRRSPDAFIQDPLAAARRAVAMVREARVQAVSGEWIPIRADTLCLHGDNPQAVSLIQNIRQQVERAGIKIAALGEWLP
jgi:UPF0271 protein